MWYSFFQGVSLARHVTVLVVLALSAIRAAGFEWAGSSGRYKAVVPFAWSTADMLVASFII